jgi:hypothetical protein
LTGAEDDAHAAAGDLFEQVVIPQLPDGWGQRKPGGRRPGGLAEEASRAEFWPHPGWKRGAAIRTEGWIHSRHRTMESCYRRRPR